MRRPRFRHRMTEEQFRSRLQRDGECLIYVPPRAKPREKTQVRWGGVQLPPYQLMWFLEYGRIPDGHSILRKCRNPLCCRREHLVCLPLGHTLASMRHRKLDAAQIAIARMFPVQCVGSRGILVKLAARWGVGVSYLRTLRTPSSRAGLRGRRAA